MQIGILELAEGTKKTAEHTHKPTHTHPMLGRVTKRSVGVRRTSTAAATGAATRAKKAVKKYGALSVGVYGAAYAGTLGCTYAALSSGVVDPDALIDALRTPAVERWVDLDGLDPKKGTFALAWILTKFTEPLRLAGTAAITPPLARAIGARRDGGKSA